MGDPGEATSEASERPTTKSNVVSLEEISSALEIPPDILKIAEQQAEETALRRGRWWGRAVLVLILAGLICLVWFLLHQSVTARQILRDHGWYMLLSGMLGASVGTSELVSRYRDEPTQALRSAPALTYLALNALVSVCVYGLLTRYARTLLPALVNDPLMRSITAGFGAMAVLRSKFFTLRTEKGEDIGVGPDAAISAFLSAADRGVDRTRAKRRLDLVFKSASRVPDYSYVKDFVKVSLLSFQNLNESEKQNINNKIDEIYNEHNKNYPSDELKLQAMCYAVLIIVGEYNFNRLINNLIDFIKRREQELKARKDLAKRTTDAFVDQLRQSVAPAKPAQQAGARARRSRGGQPVPGSFVPDGIAEPTERTS